MILKALKNIIILITPILFFASCIFEELPACGTQNTTVCFSYTLNKSETDQICDYADCIDLYIFDQNGRFLRKESQNNSNQSDRFKMNINLPAGKYSFLAVGYKTPFFEIGEQSPNNTNKFNSGIHIQQTHISDFRVKCVYTNQNCFPDNIESLLIGSFRSVCIKSDEENVYTIHMIQNKNRINLRLSGIRQSEYTPILLSNNGRYNSENNIPVDAQQKIYTPKWDIINQTYTFDVLRLIENKEIHLLLIDKNGNTLSDFKSPNLIGEIMKSPSYQTQKDLDKEDTYNLELQITSNAIVGITINGWENIIVKPES